MGIPPAKETFFHVAMRTCFGWNVSVPTIASLAGGNMWSNNWRNMRKFQSSSHDPSKTKELPSQRKRYWKLNINTNLISAFSHSLISMPSLSFLEYKSRSNLDELKFISGGVWSTWCQDEASTTTYVTNHSGPLLLCTTGLKFNKKNHCIPFEYSRHWIKQCHGCQLLIIMIITISVSITVKMMLVLPAKSS